MTYETYTTNKDNRNNFIKLNFTKVNKLTYISKSFRCHVFVSVVSYKENDLSSRSFFIASCYKYFLNSFVL